jgi:hypothetical protein
MDRLFSKPSLVDQLTQPTVHGLTKTPGPAFGAAILKLMFGALIRAAAERCYDYCFFLC